MASDGEESGDGTIDITVRARHGRHYHWPPIANKYYLTKHAGASIFRNHCQQHSSAFQLRGGTGDRRHYIHTIACTARYTINMALQEQEDLGTLAAGSDLEAHTGIYTYTAEDVVTGALAAQIFTIEIANPLESLPNVLNKQYIIGSTVR